MSHDDEERECWDVTHPWDCCCGADPDAEYERGLDL